MAVPAVRKPKLRAVENTSEAASTRERLKLQVTVEEIFSQVKPLLDDFDNVDFANPKLVSVTARNTLAATKVIDNFIDLNKLLMKRFRPADVPEGEFAKNILDAKKTAAKLAYDDAVKAKAGDDKVAEAFKELERAEANLEAFEKYDEAVAHPLREEKHDLVLRTVKLSEIGAGRIKQSRLALMFRRGIVVDDAAEE